MIVSKCAICCGKVKEREVSEEVMARNDFVVIDNAQAGVCVECGKGILSTGVVDMFGNIEINIIDRKRLRQSDDATFEGGER